MSGATPARPRETELLAAAKRLLRMADAFHDDRAYYIEIHRSEIEHLRVAIAKAERQQLAGRERAS